MLSPLVVGNEGAVGETTMPVSSLPVRDVSFQFSLLQQYLILLKKYPILTKSFTSGILSALGNLLSQYVEARKKAKRGAQVNDIDVAGAVRYAIYGLIITGPISHVFYQLMEVWMPTTDRFCIIKRLLLDRLIFAPGFLLLFYFVMNILEAKGWDDFEQKLKRSYWSALKMNWKVWTPFQFINVNFVPVQFRVLFANMIALFWYAYLASVRK
ncbi:peroxisomal membrane protein 2 [Nothobranchius furzeri]|uniref:Peroxisomal membrane protein 2 n=2 Tax=Nothobranchius TaxID=28779 RepID=A0A1A8A9L1_NOTFU|nr:peroxisomal membrane protein 2 [Nothobranchius furzeri]KAF7200235.1 peroxisomal membrane protein 2 [Nothobranchius furzeri]